MGLSPIVTTLGGAVMVGLLVGFALVARKKRSFAAWVLLIRRRQGPDQLELHKAGLVQTGGMGRRIQSHPFLKLLDSKSKDILPLPDTSIAVYKGKPVYAYYVSTPKSYTPIMGVAKYNFPVKKVTKTDKDGNVIEEDYEVVKDGTIASKKKFAMFEWLKKRIGLRVMKEGKDLVMAGNKHIYEPIVSGYTLPVAEYDPKKDKTKVMSVWGMIPAVGFNERVAYAETNRVIRDLWSLKDKILQYMPIISVVVSILMIVIVLWQLGNLATAVNKATNSFAHTAQALSEVAKMLAHIAGK